MIKLGSRCIYCKHYNRNDPGTCDAFPRGIPAKFIHLEAEHLTPSEGDHGIFFELNPQLNADSLRRYKKRFEKSDR